MVDLNVLIRRGFLARDEEGFRAGGDLSGLDNKALKDVKTSKIWQESGGLRIIPLTCSVASIVQGWAQGAIGGVNQFWSNEVGWRTGLIKKTKDIGSTREIWRFSAIHAIFCFSDSTLRAFLCNPKPLLVLLTSCLMRRETLATPIKQTCVAESLDAEIVDSTASTDMVRSPV